MIRVKWTCKEKRSSRQAPTKTADNRKRLADDSDWNYQIQTIKQQRFFCWRIEKQNCKTLAGNWKI